MATLNVTAGDIFLVPTQKDGTLGYLTGRVLSYNKAATVEIFDHFSHELTVNRQVLCQQVFRKEDRLFPPIMAVFLFDRISGKKKWPLLGASASFDKNERNHGAVFLTPVYHETGLYVEDGESKQDPENQRSRIAEASTIWQNQQIIFRTRFYMDGLMKKGEIFDYSGIAGQLLAEGRLNRLMAEAIAISDEVSSKIKIIG